jgi:HD domain
VSHASWWGSKVRQFRAHVRARVVPGERAGLATWLDPSQLALFDAMHVADRRHGLDVVATLRAEGVNETDVLVAGLLHDAGKDQTGVWSRVVYSLGQAYGSWIWRVASIVPGVRRDVERLRDHAETSAKLAAVAGCSARTVELIRHQDDPRDAEYGELLRLADEAN